MSDEDLKRVAAQENGESDVYPSNPDKDCCGITLREYYAGLALQGLASRSGGLSCEEVAEDAVRLADALLLALETSRKE